MSQFNICISTKVKPFFKRDNSRCFTTLVCHDLQHCTVLLVFISRINVLLLKYENWNLKMSIEMRVRPRSLLLQLNKQSCRIIKTKAIPTTVSINLIYRMIFIVHISFSQIVSSKFQDKFSPVPNYR